MDVWPEFEVGANYSVPPDFDPVSQPIWYLLKNGTVDYPFNFDRIDRELFYSTQWSVVHGCTIGAAVMTLLHVLALTPLTKRRTLIFWLNVVGLGQVIARGVVASLYFTRDRFETFYVVLAGDSASVPPLHRFHSTLSVILSLTMIATVEVIFFVQGRAILSSLPRPMYFVLLTALILFGVVAMTARLIYAVYNIQDIWVWNRVQRDISPIPHWVEPATLGCYVVTIGSWSFVWTCFIGRQIFLRWRMNIMRGKSFGAMNVLFLAGIQSMILPIFFLIMQFVPEQHSFIGAAYIVIPSVLCLMPFSCLWAGTISSANGQGCDETNRTPHSLGLSSKLPFAKISSSAKSHSTNNTTRNLSRASATSQHRRVKPVKSARPTTNNHVDKLYPELRDDDQIAVTQTYTVHTDGSSRNDSAV
ncbi:hypothetical protein EPUS_01570 [Endocarpon pusillum Z07020]|uniref:Uncharacterized protein n=1 Tax=Endocarpon pusillum (strain Z07020 / HMAS-L-300199) TaxID=1263415 RepID=U1HY26_ENDPU|nr:uncharacterized protein EPUS_01570 [Endocarpon pusillum Z07020]ERF75740.1 hypothetical protein EPUS_01570 [Endocarpon pusillum Z07020]